MRKLNLIFLIDDNKITQFISLKTIESTNCVKEIKCFKNAEGALSDLVLNTDSLPELILLDLHMPIMDGWEFIEQFNLLQPAVRGYIKLCVLTSSLHPAPRRKEFFNHAIICI